MEIDKKQKIGNENKHVKVIKTYIDESQNICEQYIKGLEAKYLQSDETLKGEYESFVASKKGISDEELKNLLKEFPEIPNSLIELLKYSNGTNIYCFQSDVDAGKYPYYLIDSATMINSKNDAKEYYSWAITREFDDIEIDARITNDIDNIKWLLFSNCMNNGGTSQLFIDFTPSKEGKVGQVVRYLHDPDSMIVIADSFDEYLQKIIDSNYLFVDGEEETNEWLKNNPIKPQKSKNKNKIGITLLLSIIIQLALFVIIGILEEPPIFMAIIVFLLIPTNIILFLVYIVNKLIAKKK